MAHDAVDRIADVREELATVRQLPEVAGEGTIGAEVRTSCVSGM